MIDSASEKRRFERVVSQMPIQYKKLKQPAEGTVGAISINISEGGVRFLANEFLPLASRLVIEVFVPAQPRPVKAISKVAWIRKMPEGEQYEIGNQFLDIAREDKISLGGYVKKSSTATFCLHSSRVA